MMNKTVILFNHGNGIFVFGKNLRTDTIGQAMAIKDINNDNNFDFIIVHSFEEYNGYLF